MDRAARMEGVDLDAEQTLNRTIRAGGRFTPVLETRRLRQDVLVLVDVERGDHPWLGGFARVLDAWRSQGVGILRYDFQYNPATLVDTETREPIDIDELSRRTEGLPVIFFSRKLEPEARLGTASVSRRLWAIAEAHTPDDDVAAYTQAIMDLGATVCTRNQPRCDECPLNGDCLALAEGRESALPHPRPRKATPIRETVFVIVRDPRGRVLLERRPPAGVWGGLWSFPECDSGTDVRAWCREHLGLTVQSLGELDALRHTFSHFRLDIRPVLVGIDASVAASAVADNADRQWYDGDERIGLAAPVTRLLGELRSLVD